jgi:hypothetical protein
MGWVAICYRLLHSYGRMSEQIPLMHNLLQFIVTETIARVNIFSKSFLPLLAPGSSKVCLCSDSWF